MTDSTSKTSDSVDGLQNVVSGLGTEKAKTSHNQFSLENFAHNFAELDAAYQTSWIVRKICDVPPEDMVREWRDLRCDAAEEIAAEETRLDLKHNCHDAMTWARLHGGAAVLMITNQDLAKPLNLNKIKKGGLERLLVFDRWELGATSINTTNPLSQNYLMPDHYRVTGGDQEIHWSHFARFFGAKLPRRMMAYTQGWGDSEVRKCMQDIKDVISSKDGIAELMQEANIDVITRTGLNLELASEEDEKIKKRYMLFSQMKSIVNMALLDGDETLTRNTLNLSGVAPILDNFMTWLAGCVGIPMTKLFGESPGGLNSTGESDLSHYYDRISAERPHSLERPLSCLDQVLVRSAIGEWPDDFDYEWNPLSQPDVLERSQAQLTDAQRDRIYLEDDVISKDQVRASLQSAEVYQFDDAEMSEDDDFGDIESG